MFEEPELRAQKEIRAQKLVSAEDVQGQIAVTVVVPVEKLPLLVSVQRSVQRVVGGVEIQHDRLLRPGKILDEKIHEQICNLVGLGCNLVVPVRPLFGLGGVLKPSEGRFTGQWLPLIGLVGSVFPGRVFFFSGQHCPGRILSKLIVIVEILVAFNQAYRPLGKKLIDFMLSSVGVSVVVKTIGRLPEEVHLLGDLSNQESPRISRDAISGKLGLLTALSQAFKRTLLCRTLRLHRVSRLLVVSNSLTTLYNNQTRPMPILS